MKLKSDIRVAEKFKRYPPTILPKMQHLRDLVLSVAKEMEEVDQVEETLKWGEPSYLTRYGSTVRMDWKQKNPNRVAIYFKCTSKLVPTFKALYGDKFTYENNRAILFQLSDDIPEVELRHCISMALNYHKVKHLPLLGG